MQSDRSSVIEAARSLLPAPKPGASAADPFGGKQRHEGSGQSDYSGLEGFELELHRKDEPDQTFVRY